MIKRFPWHLRVSPQNRQRLIIGGSVLLALFVLVNIGVGVAYRDRTYPGATVMGKQIGSVSFENLKEEVNRVAPLPDSLHFVHNDQKTTLTSSQLGLTLDGDGIKQSAQERRSWLPLIDLMRSMPLELPLKASNMAKLSPELAERFRREPSDAHLTLSGTEVGVAPEEVGYELDQASFEQSILRQVANGKTTVEVPTRAVKPKVTAADLADDKKELQSRLATQITFRYGERSRPATVAEVAAWYQRRGEIFEVTDDKVRAFVDVVGDELNIRVKDAVGVVATVKQALESKKATTVALAKQPAAKVYSYCVAVEGVSGSYLSSLRSQAQSTLTDAKGWSMKGLIEFREVTSGCDFTIWLAAAASVPAFSSDCDTVWSCRVGSNVIANFDRWQNASAAWQSYGGTIEGYRHMTINHELGHWFGFGHSDCPSAGQKAPLMQQQSLNLDGCTFNPWPTPDELQALRGILGI